MKKQSLAPEKAKTGAAAAGEKGVTSAGTQRPSYYVGIGASAGGLEALQVFFDHMRPDSGMAFVVVQHLSPDYKSLMVELLSKHTRMKVLRVEDGMPIAANCVYLIPPNKNMVIHGGTLFLSDQPLRHGLNLPIDVFLRALAEDQGEKAIGVILSGTGSDGTRGVRALKEEGGVVMVQDELSAKFDGMPKSAIATGLADFVLPPEKMPIELMSFINHPIISGAKDTGAIIGREEDALSRILGIIKKQTKVDFSYYKPNTVLRRIERRMGIAQVHTVEDYIAYTHRNPKEIMTLYKDLLIGVTKFFRDSAPFQMLRNSVIPEIFKEAAEVKSDGIRIWAPGCATGEEAYSIAMTFKDFMDNNGLSEMGVKVFATDIDRQAVEFAGVGMYPDSIAADVEVSFLSRYFNKRDGGYQVKRPVREMVVFAVQNVIYDPPFTKIDLVSCRNLLIYLQPMLQKKVLSIFNYALKPRGYLFLGSSESTGEMAEFFEPTDTKNRLYRHRGRGMLPLKNPVAGGAPDRSRTPLSALYDKYDGQRNRRRFEAKEQYYHALVNRIVPAMLVVNEERELVQAFGSPQDYLAIPLGNVTYDVLTLLPRELSLAVSSGLLRVRKERQALVYDNIRTTVGGKPKTVAVRIDRLPEPKSDGELYTIILEDQTGEADRLDAASGTSPEKLADDRIYDLEQELQFTRENLQATIEELQTSNEELQATNEELLAANEELQSSNEELQSVNEELNTVNTEYQQKVVELTELNNLIHNLMRSTDIGTLFLDQSFRIRQFTRGIAQEFHLLDQDIGRPVTDLAIPIMDSVIQEAKAVMASGTPFEKTIREGDEWFLMRILPFRNDVDEVDGVVITLVNITGQKRHEAVIENQYKILKQVLELSPAAQLMVDGEGVIRYANRHAEEIFESETGGLLGKHFSAADLPLAGMNGASIPAAEGPFETLRSLGKPLDNFIVSIQNQGSGKAIFNVVGNPVYNSENRIDGAVMKLQPIAQMRSTG